MESAKADQRRATGERTQARLMDAALDLLAERGEEGVTLRELTHAADANVAAVSYHFGSLKSLFDAAIEHALEHYLDAQQAAVSALALRGDARGNGGGICPADDQRPHQGRSRSRSDPHRGAGRNRSSEGMGRFDARFDQIRADVVRVLKAHLPGVKAPELIFRTRCAAGMLNWLALAPVGGELSGKSEKQAERLLVPIVAGALRGTGSG